MLTGNHVSNVSYFGDQLKFEFPSSEESLVTATYATESNNCSPALIERIGSVLIKSGINRVSPFPLDNDGIKHQYNDMDTTDSEHEDSKEILNQSSNQDIKDVRGLSRKSSHSDDSIASVSKREIKSNFGSIRSFTNPYLSGSRLKRLYSSSKAHTIKPSVESQNSENVNVEDLKIPRRSSKRLVRRQSSLRKQHIRQQRKYVQRLPSIQQQESPVKKELPIRPSMKRIDTLTRSNTNKRSNSIQRKLSKKLNSDSIHTLASDVKKSRNTADRKGKEKSVDFAALDKLLDELLAENEDSSKSNSPSPSLSSVALEGNLCVKKEGSGSPYSSNEVISYISGDELREVKPFNRTKSISRNSTLKRSLTNLQREIILTKPSPISKRRGPVISQSIETERLLKSLESETNKSMNERRRADSENLQKCELKRSNAIKRKNVFVESLITILRLVKIMASKCVRIFRKSKKDVAFKRKENFKVKKTGVQGKTIGQPILVDIAQTPFKSQMLNTTTKGTTIPIVKKVNESVETLKPLQTKRISTVSLIKEEDEEILSSVGPNDEELISLWKHYLGKTVVNRIEMKLDINKANHIERVNSVKSSKSLRRNNSRICETEQNEINNIIKKYVRTASVNSETSSTKTLSEYETDRYSSNPSASVSFNNSIMSHFESNLAISRFNSMCTKSTGWATISEDEDLIEEDCVSTSVESHYSSSTLGEENRTDESEVSDFIDNDNSSDFSVSTFGEDDDVYQQYSIISEKLEEEADGPQFTPEAPLSVMSSFRSSRIKPSNRLLNLSSVLKKGESNGSDFYRNNSLRKNTVIQDSYKRLSRNGSVISDDQDSVITARSKFSYQTSVYA